MNLNGLAVVNIELTNACNKNCFMCGRRKAERDYPDLFKSYNKVIDWTVLKILAEEIPSDIVIQFHNNGEPLLYPRLGEALDLFPNNIKCFNTNGKLLLEKADEIIDKLDTLTISVIQDDPDGDAQYETVTKFLALKKDKKPYMVYRVLGNVAQSRWLELPGLVCTRILHSPMGSYNYTRKVTKPEIGVCLDLLNHCAIDVEGNVSICVRFDPNKYGVLGNIKHCSLEKLWNSVVRKNLIREHLKGNRAANKLCEQCHFYGVPTS